MLPEGWKLKSLKQIGECISGLTYSPDNITDKENGRLLVLRSSNIKNGSIVLEDNVYVDSCVDDTKLTRSKDILICVRNGSKSLIGKSAIITNPDAIGQAHGAFMSVFRSESNEYIFQLFQTSMFYRQVSADLGATINSINTNNLLKYKFPIPPLPEQKKIAQILSAWDNAISATERLLENSQQRKKGLMQQLLTGKKRLPGFVGEWRELKVHDVLSSRKEKRVPNEENPLYSLTIESGVTEKTDRYNREFLVKDKKEKTYKLVKPRDLVYNPANLRWGAINYSRLDFPVVVSPIYEVLYITDQKSHDLEFIAFLLMQPDQINRFASMVEGTLIERMAVKIEPFMATKIRVPPSLNEEKAISSVLTTADQEIDALQKRLDHLKQEKKALMQQLLTGKRRVQVDDAA